MPAYPAHPWLEGGGAKAPFSWPKSSDAISEGGIAAQLTRTNGRFERRDRLWMAPAINSFPVPVSPKIRTVVSECATLLTCASTRRCLAVFGLG
jgi:hypothetical protein